MKSLLLSGFSFLLSGAVIANAYYQKKQFYPSVVYITKSNPSMAVLYIQAFVFVILMGKLLRKIFFGQLRAAEMEHLIERSWYAVTETCLAFTVFRDDFSPRFVALFTLLLFLKCFHWLAEDRVDYMERSPVISILFHIRVLSLLSFLALLDLYFVNHAYYSTLLKGPTVQLVFGFEYAVLATMVLMTFIKYVLHTVDQHNENPWDSKAVYLLYTELVIGFVRVLLYLFFVVIMIKVHTFPLFAIRPMYLAVRSFKKALHDVIMSRRAIRNMNTLYPDATAEELSSGDNVCIICREEMTSSCKKLPCNHIFHTSCLRSWFQRQQTCPTCRLDVLRMPRLPPPAPAPANPQPNNAQQQQQMFQNFNAMFGGFPYAWPPPPIPPQGQVNGQPTPQSQASSSSTNTPTTNSNTSANSSHSTTGANSSPFSATATTASPPLNPFASMPFFMPFNFPPPPSSLSGLSEEELKTMEGWERSNVEARIQWLRDIQALLDGAMVLIAQYNQVAANMRMSGIQMPSSSAEAQSTSMSAPTWQAVPKEVKKKASSPSIPTANVTANAASLGQSASFSNSSVNGDEKLDFEGLEGATGFTPPRDREVPEWENPQEEEHEDELHEVRRRRVQRFTQSGLGKVENLELD